ncbi:MAG: putative metal-binding motif-containing protein [Myxococcales bacterium]|nr:putative metal-binding motif-containing protein [Myxococcales bacterium]
MTFRSISFALLAPILVGCGGSSVEFAPDDDTGVVGDATPTDGSVDTRVDGAVDGAADAPVDTSPPDTFDPEKDKDGDGYKAKDDCNDDNPAVNPGAFEIPGDKIDNDCDGKVDNDEPDCDKGDLKLDSKDPLDFARALGLCRATTADALGKDKKWGVISAKLVAVDGAGTVDPLQHGIHGKFGAVITPRQGKNLVALSSGTARTPTDPGFVQPRSPSLSTPSSVTPPAGFPKNVASCPAASDLKANDSVALELTLRVPTNAKSLRYDFDLFTSEYLAFVCSAYHDQFVTLLDSTAALDAKYAKNITFDSSGIPIGASQPAFLEVCKAGTSGTGGLVFPCAKGVKELEGTGFLESASPAENGSTSWLSTQAAVVPGETITIRFMIWDVSDHLLDSTVLLDNFRWDVGTVATPVTARP